MANGNNPKSVREIFGLLIKSPELENFTFQYIRFKIKTLINTYCRQKWGRELVREVFWKHNTLFVKVSEPLLKKELNFHTQEILRKLSSSGFKFKEIKLI